MYRVFNKCIAMLVVISLTGCSLIVPNAAQGQQVSTEEKKSVVAQHIDQQWDHISDHIDSSGRAVSNSFDGSLVVEEMLQEEKGEAYLDFCFDIANGADPQVLLEKAEELVSPQQYEQLLKTVDQARTMIMEEAASRVLAIDEDNQEKFYKDLRKLVVSTTVLLTASVVYSAMPHIYFWGKISALAAVSVSAGAAAGTVISVYDWYINDVDMVDAFSDWIKMITDEPYAAYLMATSVISLGQSMNMNPVSCSVILGVFTVFNALNIVRDMLEAYGEQA